MEPVLVFRHRVHDEVGLRNIQFSSLVSGIECDIRYRGGLPYLNHDIDKSASGIRLDVALKYLKNKYIILNIKETGGELSLIKTSQEYGAIPLILDSPFPAIRSIYDSGFGSTVMWRMSEYETLNEDQLLDMPPRWIWLDSFHRYWFDKPGKLPSYLKECNVCLVSSELQGRDPFAEWKISKRLIASGIVKAICTKYPHQYNGIITHQRLIPRARI